MIRTKVLLLLATCLPLFGSEHGLRINSVHSQAGKLALYHSAAGFTVVKSNKAHAVDPVMMDAPLRKISPAQLALLQQKGFVTVTKASDGKYALRANAKGPGGGPILGLIAYGAVKGLCYGGIALAASATAIGTILASIPTAGVPLAVTGATVLTTVGVTSTTAATTVVGATLGAGGVVGLMASIEAAAVTASVVCGALPTP